MCYLLVSCSENHDENNIITIGGEKGGGNYLYRNELFTTKNKTYFTDRHVKRQ